MEILAFLLIIFGIITCLTSGWIRLRDKDEAWQWHERGARARGLNVERTQEWEDATTSSGYVLLIAGVFLLGSLVWAGFGIWNSPQYQQQRRFGHRGMNVREMRQWEAEKKVTDRAKR